MARIGIFGAGAVGCHIGGRLALGGAGVRILGRETRQSALTQGARLTDLDARDAVMRPEIVTDPGALADCDLVLVTVRAGQTVDAARELAPVLHPKALVISLQNGVRNRDCLARHLPGVTVIAGMVPFNLVWPSPVDQLRGGGGQLMVQDHPALTPWLPAFAQAGLPIQTRADMQAVLWGKLLLSLNNAINALADLPLAAQLSQPLFRRCLALAMAEALALLQVQRQIIPARTTPLPNSLLPTVLRLPNWILMRAAPWMLAIDEKARSSMSDDLAAGRPTEIDWINGEIVELGDRLGIPAPINRRLCQLIREAGAAPNRPNWTGARLLTELRLSRYVPSA